MKYFLCFFSVLLIMGCGSEEAPVEPAGSPESTESVEPAESSAEEKSMEDYAQFEGIAIIKGRPESDILVVPNTDKEEVRATLNNSGDEMIGEVFNAAIEFDIPPEAHEKVEEGDHIIVYYDSDQLQEESDPPQMNGEGVKIISNGW